MAEGFRKRWFKHRMAALLLVLMGVLAWRAVIRIEEDRRVDWNVPHRVVICPLTAPGTDVSALGDRLGAAPARLESWATAQHEFWTGRRGRPLEFVVLPPMPVAEMPPWLPARDDSFWKRYRGTRRFLDYLDEQARRWAPREGDDTRIFLYVYRNLDRGAFEDRLPVGTKRGRMGVVFASDAPRDWDNVLCLVLHEMLHAVGARDHRSGDETISFPEGYADPSARPLLPQGKAEIMALGIPVTETEELRVDSLDDVVMGLWTAKEIGWR